MLRVARSKSSFLAHSCAACCILRGLKITQSQVYVAFYSFEVKIFGGWHGYVMMVMINSNIVLNISIWLVALPVHKGVDQERNSI